MIQLHTKGGFCSAETRKDISRKQNFGKLYPIKGKENHSKLLSTVMKTISNSHSPTINEGTKYSIENYYIMSTYNSYQLEKRRGVMKGMISDGKLKI